MRESEGFYTGKFQILEFISFFWTKNFTVPVVLF